MSVFESVQAFMRRQAREAYRKRHGFLHASGFSVGTAASRTPKRAAQRQRRRQEKLEVLRASQHNPAGSKLLRRIYKMQHGVRGDYQEAADYHAQ